MKCQRSENSVYKSTHSLIGSVNLHGSHTRHPPTFYRASGSFVSPPLSLFPTMPFGPHRRVSVVFCVGAQVVHVAYFFLGCLSETILGTTRRNEIHRKFTVFLNKTLFLAVVAGSKPQWFPVCLCISLFCSDILLVRDTSAHLYSCTATHCSTLQHTATHSSTLQHTPTHCNTLQHTAAH